jgi:hypothetical protein
LTAFEAQIPAGTSMPLTVLIGNNGDIAQDIRTYPTNVFTAEGGGMGADAYGEAPNSVTAWLDYPEEVFEFQPGEGVERSFTVNVPSDAPPGEYITAIAGEHADSAEVEGSENFSQRLRYVIPVFITVPGEMSADFSVGDISLQAQSDILLIRVPVINPGDMHVYPEGDVVLRDPDGNVIATIPVVMQGVFAREQTNLTVGVPGGLPPGTYQVDVTLTDPRSGVTVNASNPNVVANPPATPEPVMFLITQAAVTPAPSVDDVQFANVEAVIANSGEPVSNAQLSLIARVNGEEVERFPISQSLALPTGETPITTRYIPATGWTSGEWTFELLLETVDPSGAAVVVGRQVIDGSIIIP